MQLARQKQAQTDTDKDTHIETDNAQARNDHRMYTCHFSRQYARLQPPTHTYIRSLHNSRLSARLPESNKHTAFTSVCTTATATTTAGAATCHVSYSMCDDCHAHGSHGTYMLPMLLLLLALPLLMLLLLPTSAAAAAGGAADASAVLLWLLPLPPAALPLPPLLLQLLRGT